MNHNSLPLAKILQEKGLLQDSEKVWIEPTQIGRELFTPKIPVSRKTMECYGSKGYPAGNCEELGELLWFLDEIVLLRERNLLVELSDCYKIKQQGKEIGELIFAKTETEAREQALLWYFKNIKETG